MPLLGRGGWAFVCCLLFVFQLLSLIVFVVFGWPI